MFCWTVLVLLAISSGITSGMDSTYTSERTKLAQIVDGTSLLFRIMTYDNVSNHVYSVVTACIAQVASIVTIILFAAFFAE